MTRGIGANMKGADPRYGTENRTGPTNYYTPYSSAVGGNTTIDPSVRGIQNDFLRRNMSLYGDVGGATDKYLSANQSLRDAYGANNGAYVQARVNPVLQRFGALQAQTQQSLGQRGLSGSSFQDQAMRNIQLDASLAEGDARALATNESFNAMRGLNSDDLGAMFQRIQGQSALNGESNQIAQQRFAQEMAGLGMSQQQIQQMINEFQNQQDRQFRQLQETRAQRNDHNQAIQGWVSSSKGGGGTPKV